MRYALIENGKVAMIVGNDPANLFAPEYAALFRPCGNGVEVGWLDDGTTFTAPPTVPVNKASLALLIDEAVGKIYDKYTRYEPEYKEREIQALDYKAAGYTGTVPVQVAAFATPSGNTSKAAADIIIGQSSQLRGALSQLGVLRMRKYEVLRAVDDATATAAFNTITANVEAIGKAIA